MFTYKKLGDKYILSIDTETEIFSAFEKFCNEIGAKSGIIGGLGAVSEAVLRFFDPVTKQYVDKTFTEQMEIANLTGNISRMDGKVYLHIHIVLGRRDCTSLAGHLLSARLRGAGEFFVEVFDEEVCRKFNSELGLNCYEL